MGRLRTLNMAAAAARDVWYGGVVERLRAATRVGEPGRLGAGVDAGRSRSGRARGGRGGKGWTCGNAGRGGPRGRIRHHAIHDPWRVCGRVGRPRDVRAGPDIRRRRDRDRADARVFDPSVAEPGAECAPHVVRFGATVAARDGEDSGRDGCQRAATGTHACGTAADVGARTVGSRRHACATGSGRADRRCRAPRRVRCRRPRAPNAFRVRGVRAASVAGAPAPGRNEERARRRRTRRAPCDVHAAS